MHKGIKNSKKFIALANDLDYYNTSIAAYYHNGEMFSYSWERL